MKGELALVMDGTTLIPDKVYDAIITPNKWRRITIIKRKTVDQGQLQQARDLAKDVFGKIFPDGEDALARELKNACNQWREQLSNYKSKAETGNYPGSEEIASGLTLLNKLLAEHENFELISRFMEMKNDMLNLSDDMQELENFYSTQRPSWEKLISSLNDFELNRQYLDRDEKVAAALSSIETILKSKSPYAMIKNSESLIDTVTRFNNELVKRKKEKAKELIDKQVTKVTNELDKVDADSDMRNKSLLPLQQLKDQASRHISLAHIFQAQNDAIELADTALNNIDEHVSNKVKENDPPVYVKPRHITYAAKLNKRAYLESPEDIEEFIKELRKEMEEAIASGKRIEIR